MKSIWFSETIHPDIKIVLKAEKSIYSSSKSGQSIKLLKSRSFGKILVLDGAIQTTIGDEFIYHEMMTQIPLFSHPNPRKILIIGGGDGGCLREVLKHKRPQQITLVEIEEKVVHFSEKYLPEICRNSFRAPRLNLVIADGAQYVKKTKSLFDLVIVDSPDPIGCAKTLFRKEFYKNCAKILNKNGILVRHSGSSFLQKDVLRQNYRKIKSIFKNCFIYTAAIPTYIGGLFTFIFGSDSIEPAKIKNLDKIYKRSGIKTKYYNPGIHTASFQLPNYIRQIIGENNG